MVSHVRLPALSSEARRSVRFSSRLTRRISSPDGRTRASVRPILTVRATSSVGACTAIVYPDLRVVGGMGGSGCARIGAGGRDVGGGAGGVGDKARGCSTGSETRRCSAGRARAASFSFPFSRCFLAYRMSTSASASSDALDGGVGRPADDADGSFHRSILSGDGDRLGARKAGRRVWRDEGRR
jgi:hypothetical protein